MVLVRRKSTYDETEKSWLKKAGNSEMSEEDMRRFVLEKAKELENSGKVCVCVRERGREGGREREREREEREGGREGERER